MSTPDLTETEPQAPAGLPDVTLTPEQLAERFVPKAQYVLRAIGPEIRRAVGLVKWMAIGPVWTVITQAVVLRIGLRVSIEMAVADTAPWVLPVVEGLEPLVERFAVDVATKVAFAEALSLLRTPLDRMTPAVRDAVHAPPAGPPD